MTIKEEIEFLNQQYDLHHKDIKPSFRYIVEFYQLRKKGHESLAFYVTNSLNYANKKAKTYMDYCEMASLYEVLINPYTGEYRAYGRGFFSDGMFIRGSDDSIHVIWRLRGECLNK